MQAQGHVQLVTHLADADCNIQEAIERPRFNFLGGHRVALEAPLEASVGAALARRGHDVADEAAAVPYSSFGGAQAIVIDPDTGAYWGAADRARTVARSASNARGITFLRRTLSMMEARRRRRCTSIRSFASDSTRVRTERAAFSSPMAGRRGRQR